MKRILMAAAAVSLLTGAAGAASAQPHPGFGGPGPNHGDMGHNPGGGHNWQKGGRIERGDWNRGVHVDYRAHHLRAPPRGYEWRQVDGNYVLAAVATGVIADILLSQ
jgi:opacity protein-like surface antigen